jgi:hypothetical protein
VKKNIGVLICCFFILGGVAAFASDSTPPRQFQTAVVVSVEGHDPDTALHRKATDAPAPLTEFDANVSIRLNCVVYVGRYKSAIDYMPGVFEAGHSVEVSPGKPFMYVKVPGNGVIKLRVVRRDPVARDSCKDAPAADQH